MTKDMLDTTVSGERAASQALNLAASSFSTLATMLGLTAYIEPARARPSRPHLPHFTLDQVSEHYCADDCWIVLYDRVYDITEFLRLHPGGFEIMLESAGHDATTAFRGVGHSEQAVDALQQYQVGLLVPAECMW